MKMAIVGAGKIVDDFLTINNLISSKYEIVMMCGTEKDLSHMKELREKYEIPSITTNYDELLGSDAQVVYLGIPNHLHYSFAAKAIKAGKNVICEKPIVSSDRECTNLYDLAEKYHVMIFEAITNQYMSNYKNLKDDIKRLGDIHLVTMNYSQYSSRYDLFKQGIVQPVFDTKACGGALMDLNVYNVHFIIGLFGKPLNAVYYPNMSNGIDSSGICILQYPGLTCSLSASKDTECTSINTIQGENGCIKFESPANKFERYEISLAREKSKVINVNPYSHRMVEEFLEINEIITNEDKKKYKERCDESKIVCNVINAMRINAGILFPGDQ